MSTDLHRTAEQLRSAARQRLLAVLVERTESLNFALISSEETDPEFGTRSVPHAVYVCSVVAIHAQGLPISLEDGEGRVGTVIGFTIVKVAFSADSGEIVVSGQGKPGMPFPPNSSGAAIGMAEKLVREFQPPD